MERDGPLADRNRHLLEAEALGLERPHDPGSDDVAPDEAAVLGRLDRPDLDEPLDPLGRRLRFAREHVNVESRLGHVARALGLPVSLHDVDGSQRRDRVEGLPQRSKTSSTASPRGTESVRLNRDP